MLVVPPGSFEIKFHETYPHILGEQFPSGKASHLPIFPPY